MPTITVGTINFIEQTGGIYTLGGQTGAAVNDAVKAANGNFNPLDQDQVTALISSSQLAQGIANVAGKNIPVVGQLGGWASLVNNGQQIYNAVKNGQTVEDSWVDGALADITGLLSSEAFLIAAVAGSPVGAVIGAGLVLASAAYTIKAMADGKSETTPERMAIISQLYQAIQNYKNATGSALESGEEFLRKLIKQANNPVLNVYKPKSPPVDLSQVNVLEKAKVANPFVASQNWIRVMDPLTFDLDGDGLETTAVSTSTPILFDHDGDGIKTGTGWINADDALLVLDKNGNGVIDSGKELFGDNTIKSNGQKAVNGFDALADIDSNVDGVIDSQDTNFANLRLWRDLNQDGISQSNELFTLDSQNILSISVASTKFSQTLSNGNQIADLGTFTKTNGISGTIGEVTGTIGDINLAEDTFTRDFTDTLDTSGLQMLPDMGGSGKLRDLREASTLSTSLQDTLTLFSQASSRLGQLATLDNLLLDWANTGGMDGTLSQRVASMPQYTKSDGSQIPYEIEYYQLGNATNPFGSNYSPTFSALINEWEQKLKVVEAFNGGYFFGLPGTNQTQGALTGISIGSPSSFDTSVKVIISFSPQQLELLQQSYDSIKDTVYRSLLLQTRFKPLLDSIILDISETGITKDFSNVKSYFDQQISNDFTAGIIDLVDFNLATKETLSDDGWNGWDDFSEALADIGSNQVLLDYFKSNKLLINGVNDFSGIGTSVDDTLFGASGNDSLYGSSGDDALFGGAGNDVLVGGLGSDELRGGSGNDLLIANNISADENSSNTFIGGLGNDTLRGSAGADSYIFNLGDGADTIVESFSNSGVDNQLDRITLGAGIAVTDVTVSTVNSSDLLITIGANGDQITITGWFNDSRKRIEELVFSDGSMWDVNYIQNLALIKHGTSGNDSLSGTLGTYDDQIFGHAGDDVIISSNGAGNDKLYGGDGNDNLQTGVGNDKLFGDEGNDFLYGASGNDNLSGGLGNDTLEAGDGDDLLEGGLGTDILNGGQGSDTYIYNLGDGNDSIQQDDLQSGVVDVLQLGSGILSSNVVVTNNQGSLIIRFGSDSGQITIGNWYFDERYQIDQVKFEDGTVWNAALLSSAGIVALGTSGDDSIYLVGDSHLAYGYEGNDSIYGGTGNDSIYGGAGNDNLSGENGNDSIYGDDGNDYIDGGSGSNSLNGGTGDDTLNAGYSDPSEYGQRSNVLEGGLGNDTLIGSGAADSYIFNLGDGADSIFETPGADENAIDKIIFGAGISASNIVLSENEGDLILTIGDQGDQITIKNWGLDTWAHIENFVFSDGTIWNAADIANAVWLKNGDDSSETLYGTNIGNDEIHGNGGDDQIYGFSGNDRLYGGTGRDWVDGGEGDDTLNGGEGDDRTDGGNGSDIYEFGRGDGSDVIYEYGEDGATDYIRFTNGITLQDLKVFSWRSEDLVLYLGNGDNITIGIWSLGEQYQIERFVFSDGTTIHKSELPNLYVYPLVQNGTSGDDLLKAIRMDALNEIYAGAGNDTLFSNLGINYLDGGDGEDNFQIGEGSNTLKGGLGNDVFYDSMASDDTYQFSIGDGIDTLFESFKGSVSDRVEFGPGITLSDLSFERAENDLIIHVGNLGDQLIVKSWFFGAEIESVKFSDGTIFNLKLGTALADDIYDYGNSERSLIYGYEGDDTIQGGLNSDILDGGSGNDMLIGGEGDDTYLVDSMNDVVVETANSGIDSISLSISTSGLTYSLGTNIENASLTNSVDFNLTGNSLNNTLIGNAHANILDGGLGIDSLVGGDGDDVYVIDNASDIITETSAGGIDTVQSSITYILGSNSNLENLSLTGTTAINGTGNSLNNLIVGNSGNNTLNGGAGNDFLDGGAGTDTLIGGDGDDTFVVDATADIITETTNGGVDTVQSSVTYTLGATSNLENLTLVGANAINGTGNALNNIITGNAAANTLNGGTGVDTLIGGDGNDIYVVDTTTDVISELVNGGIDTVQSSVTFNLGATSNLDNLTLTGTAVINGTGNELDNILTGNSANNILIGGDGNDTFNGGAGTDTLVGGDGSDTYIVDSATDVITETVTGGLDTVQSSVTFVLGANSNLENLTLTGTAAINGTGNAVDNVIIGNSGNNTLSGGVGNDTLNGGAGTDTLVGGDGDDIYIVDSTTDTITETATGGIDIVQSSVTYTLGASSNLENLTLTGTAAVNGTGNTLNNVITGNSAANTLNGGTGTDILIGGDGNDIYVVDTTTDTIIESAAGGTDTVQSSITYTLSSGSNLENLTLTGTTAINATGNDLDNTLTGNSGNNILTGGVGNDTLNGAAGTDTLVGGDGNDTYVVDSTTDIITETTTGGIDTVQSSVTFTLAATSNLENLTLTGTTAINGIGNALDNFLTGNSGNNNLNGGAGNDTLNGGAGTDTLVGGDGDDTFVVDSTTDTITETTTGGVDTVQSSVTYTLGATSNLENLTLTGTTAINGTGNTLNNVITGNSAVNTLNGGTGVDTLIGGDGDDIYVVDTTTDTIIETNTGGTDTVQSSVTFTLGSNVENLTLTGTTAINGTGNELDNLITGTSANNTLSGGAGNDILNGAAGTDTLVGGDGNDIYIVDSTTDIITETASGGLDTVQSSVTFTLGATSNLENLTLTGTTAINGIGNALDNVLTGNSGNNNLNGGDGNDILNGGTGTDTLVGGNGNDTYIVDTTTDTITETSTGGMDTVQSSVTYTLNATSNLENLILTGNTAINGTGNALTNFLVGNFGNNVLTDTAGGNEVLQGLDGADTLNDISGHNLLDGGIGADTLTSGEGSDILIGGKGNDTISTGTGANLILFNKGDGVDIINSSIYAENTLSLGGGISYNDLSLSKSSDDLILKIGSSDQIVFKDWYNTVTGGVSSTYNLQVIAESMNEFEAGGMDDLRNNKVETFYFTSLVSDFDRFGSPNDWRITDQRLTQVLRSGSDAEAIGGDIAYQYGLNGSLSGVGLSAAQSVINNGYVGQSVQAINDPSSWANESIKLL